MQVAIVFKNDTQSFMNFFCISESFTYICMRACASMHNLKHMHETLLVQSFKFGHFYTFSSSENPNKSDHRIHLDFLASNIAQCLAQHEHSANLSLNSLNEHYFPYSGSFLPLTLTFSVVV